MTKPVARLANRARTMRRISAIICRLIRRLACLESHGVEVVQHFFCLPVQTASSKRGTECPSPPTPALNRLGPPTPTWGQPVALSSCDVRVRVHPNRLKCLEDASHPRRRTYANSNSVGAAWETRHTA